MKAVVLKDFGGVENLVAEDIATPQISDQEVLIKVKAISINPVDVKTRAGKGLSGKLKTENPIILGWDISGIVSDTRSPLFNKGDQVFGMVNFPGHGRTYAEYVAAPAAHLALKPETVSYEEAAATTLAALTAWQALYHNAKISAGQKALIHAASGGVGHFAVQIAKYLGAIVTGTSSAENIDLVISLGADGHINYKTEAFDKYGKDYDFVLDTIGGSNIDRSLEVIKKGGTIISLPSGLNESVKEKAEDVGVTGYSIMVQSNGEDMKSLADLMKNGQVKPHISKVFDFNEMAEAHLHVESGKTRGKIVVVQN